VGDHLRVRVADELVAPVAQRRPQRVVVVDDPVVDDGDPTVAVRVGVGALVGGGPWVLQRV